MKLLHWIKNEKKAIPAFWIGLLVFSVLMFRVLLQPGAVLFTTDDNIGALALRKATLPYAFVGGWDDSVLAGVSQLLSINWTNFLLWLLPVRFFTNWIHALDLILASWFLALFLRARGLGWRAGALASLAAFWVGSNFTLTYAGHIGKFGVLLFAAAALWLIERAVSRRSVAWGVLAGGALGAMFLEQADVALFFAMFLVPYAIYAAWRESGFSVPGLARVGVPMGAAMLLVAFQPLWSGYRVGIQGVASVSTTSPEEQWNFATQWSWPPEESIDFIAPGFMGWRSGEPEGPYYGRMGRSAEWEKTGQGFQNFKLENQYIGALPVVFALWACVAAWKNRRTRQPWTWEVLLWSGVLLVSLLLSFGRHFPLYRLFYLLPMVSSIRNPNKFLHIFQLALAILAAYGLEAVFRKDRAAPAPTLKHFLWTLGSLAGVLALWALITSAGEQSLLARFAGWGDYARVIVRNRGSALAHGAFLLGAGLAALALMARARDGSTRPAKVAAALLVLAAVDALALGRHYISAMPPNLIEESDVVRFFKANQKYQRAALVQQSGFYNAWLTYVFPYYGIRAVNVTQMPRMTEEYKQFLSRVGAQPLRMWALTSAEWIAGPAQLWGQMQNDPAMRERFELAYAFNAFPDPLGGVVYSRATAASPGQHVVIRMKDPVPRYGLLDAWKTVPDDRALEELLSPAHPPFSRVLLSPSSAAPADSGGQGLTGLVSVQKYRPGRVVLKTSSEKPTILRAGDKYEPDWKASVDGKPVPVLRADYLMIGVPIPPGGHTVVLEYAPPRGPFWVQIASVLVCALALAAVILQRRRESPEEKRA